MTAYVLEIVPRPKAGPAWVDRGGYVCDRIEQAAIFATATSAVVFSLGLPYPTEFQPIGARTASEKPFVNTKR